MNYKLATWASLSILLSTLNAAEAKLYLYPEQHDLRSDFLFKQQVDLYAKHGQVLSGKESWTRTAMTKPPFIVGLEDPITMIFASVQRTHWAESNISEHKKTVESAVSALRNNAAWIAAQTYDSRAFELIKPDLVELGHNREILEQIGLAVRMRSQLLLQLFLNGSVIDRLASCHDVMSDPIFRRIHTRFVERPKVIPVSSSPTTDTSSTRKYAFKLYRQLLAKRSQEEWMAFEKNVLIALLGTPEMQALSTEKASDYIDRLQTSQEIPDELVDFYEVSARDKTMADSLSALHPIAESLGIPLIAIVGAHHHAGIASILRDQGLQVEFESIPPFLCEGQAARDICEQKQRRMKYFAQSGSLEGCN